MEGFLSNTKESLKLDGCTEFWEGGAKATRALKELLGCQPGYPGPDFLGEQL